LKNALPNVPFKQLNDVENPEELQRVMPTGDTTGLVNNQLEEAEMTRCDNQLESGLMDITNSTKNIEGMASQDSVNADSCSAADDKNICPKVVSAAISNKLGKMDFVNNEPMRFTGAWTEFFQTTVFSTNNFTKGCKWSPDGLCVLTNSEDSFLRLFNTPQEIFNAEEETDWKNLPEMTSVLNMKESDTVYDFCWYPFMNSADPNTCCFVSTSKLNPVHMWDAFTGQIRASYRAFNHVDEVVSAVSVAFDPHGTKLYCGFNKAIRIFDVEVPGRYCTERILKTQGQTGIISCIAVNPADAKLYAAGSYLRTIALYTEPKGKQQFFFEGQTGGVTHIMFSPDGTKLYSGARKDPLILCWDLRFPDKILYAMPREVLTNQRIYFDIDSTGKYLISGSTDGIASVWDLTQLTTFNEDTKMQLLEPVASFQAQNDCVNGVSFNPVYPIFATSGGQRKYRQPVESETEEMDDDMFTDKHITTDNSLNVWLACEIR